jgi:hypothetical protein
MLAATRHQRWRQRAKAMMPRMTRLPNRHDVKRPGDDHAGNHSERSRRRVQRPDRSNI